jgi:hypothetical protein
MPLWNHSYIASTKEAATAELANRNIPATVKEAILAGIATLSDETGRAIHVCSEGEFVGVPTSGGSFETRIRRAHSDIRSIPIYS